MTHTTQVLSDERVAEVLTTSYGSPEWTMDDARAARAIESATLKAVSGQEPFGYFRSMPFGWEDCAETDDGAMPLYELPPAQPAPVDERAAFDAWYDAFEFRREYDKYGPTEAAWSAWQARAALQCAQAPQAGGWLPIETAPKDGSMFICWVNAAKIGEDDNGSQYECEASEADFCCWRRCDESPDGGYYDNMAGQIADLQHITHWQPLPPAPQPTKGQP